eukprot:1183923-Prorocentrum_minimum.AAC.1
MHLCSKVYRITHLCSKVYCTRTSVRRYTASRTFARRYTASRTSVRRYTAAPTWRAFRPWSTAGRRRAPAAADPPRPDQSDGSWLAADPPPSPRTRTAPEGVNSASEG